jgi:hypothetical protein
MAEHLMVVKRPGCYLVAFDEEGEDWVARFELDGVFPAEDWAKRMTFLYNSQNADLSRASAEDSSGSLPAKKSA